MIEVRILPPPDTDDIRELKDYLRTQAELINILLDSVRDDLSAKEDKR